MAKKVAKKLAKVGNSKATKAAPKAEKKGAKPLAKKPEKVVAKTPPAKPVKTAPVEVSEKTVKIAKPVKAPAPSSTSIEAPKKAAKASKKMEAADSGVKESREKKLNKESMSEDEAKWLDLYDKHKGEKPQSYDMKGTFEAGKSIQHKVLGWGWVVSNENDRLEVLFKDGKRLLISNYNP